MLRYLGYGGQQIEPELSRRIELVVERLELDIEPRGVRRVFAVDATGVDEQSEPCIRLVGTNVELRGRDIYRHLKMPALPRSWHVPSAWTPSVACAPREPNIPWRAPCSTPRAPLTWKPPLSKWTSRPRRTPPFMGSPATGALVPATATARSSAQRSIVNTLNATRLIGLTVTPTSLLMPTKSVTAVIGLFDGEVHDAQSRPTCNICRMRENCRFRAAHTTCYSSH